MKVDSHQTGLSAILCKGDSMNKSKPVAVASRSMSVSEKRYPQFDLQSTSVDFCLRRFQEYLVGSPEEIQVVTDHKPLRSIFKSNAQRFN